MKTFISATDCINEFSSIDPTLFMVEISDETIAKAQKMYEFLLESDCHEVTTTIPDQSYWVIEQLFQKMNTILDQDYEKELSLSEAKNLITKSQNPVKFKTEHMVVNEHGYIFFSMVPEHSEDMFRTDSKHIDIASLKSEENPIIMLDY